MKATGEKTRELSVLLGTSEPAIEECLRSFVGFILSAERELKFTVRSGDSELRGASLRVGVDRRRKECGSGRVPQSW